MLTLRKLLSGLLRNSKKKEEENRKKVSYIYTRIEKEMEKNKIYLDPDLSLESLSKMIGTNRTYVSRAICSHESGFRNYLNRYRTAHLLALLDDGETGMNYPRDGEMLALDSGFSNRRSMDRVLKKQKGTTLYRLRKKRASELKK